MQLFKAEVRTIKIGSVEFDGYLLENGEFAIAPQSIEKIVREYDPRKKKSFGNVLKKGCAKLNLVINGTGEKVKAIPLNTLDAILMALSVESKNQGAIVLMQDLAGLALAEFFCDGFKARLSVESRKERFSGMQQVSTMGW